VKKIFILVMALMFTILLFSTPIYQARIIENENGTGDQNGTFIMLPEVVTGIAELSPVIFQKVVIENTYNYEKNFALVTDQKEIGWLDRTVKTRGSVLKMPTYHLVVNIGCKGYLSAGALKISTYTTDNLNVNIGNSNCNELETFF
jgi:hypothetical protein